MKSNRRAPPYVLASLLLPAALCTTSVANADDTFVYECAVEKSGDSEAFTVIYRIDLSAQTYISSLSEEQAVSHPIESVKDDGRIYIERVSNWNETGYSGVTVLNPEKGTYWRSRTYHWGREEVNGKCKVAG